MNRPNNPLVQGRNGEQPLRLAFLTPTLHPGGAERQMLILASALAGRLFEVRFLVMSELGALAGEAKAMGARVELLGLPRGCGPVHPSCLISVARAIRRYRALTADIDIVDAWHLPAMTFAALVQPAVRVPVVMGGRRSLADQYRSKRWYRRAAASIAARRMDAIVANSRIAAAEAVIFDHVDPRRVHVIPNAVLPPLSDATARTRFRSAWGLTDEHVVVGCVANYKPAKGLPVLLEVAARLRNQAPQLRFVLVGEGPLRPRLEAEIRRLDLAGIVTLHGSEPDARRVYRSFEILVQASETEGLPNVILEAAAEGLPIVATSVGGTSEVITDERDALVVGKGDAAGLAAAILRVSQDPALRERLGGAARKRAAEFSQDRLAESTSSLYLELVRRNLGRYTGRAHA